VLVLSLVAAAITTLPSLPAHADDRASAALTRLRADAHGGLTVARGEDGRVRFVGTAAHAAVHDPSVGAGASPAGAARHHLDRYGAAFGGDPASTFDASPSVEAAGGSEVVRFSQRIDGVPVLGGELVVTENATGALESIAGGVAGSGRVSTASVSAARAEATARALVGRAHPHATLTVTDLGRWIVDPSLVGLDLPGDTRTVRRLEVRGGAGVRELVLIDDHTGRLTFRTSLVEAANRVVCDDANVRSAEVLCSSGFARTEGGAVSAETDVNKAYDYAGEVSDFYSAVSGGAIDVTQALDIHVDSVPKLAATVRFCTNTSDGFSYDDPCPFPNAFWDGRQMYYGDGYAAADDVVGHEMTHGIIDRYSQLFYWGQSGAINESLADTIGEFVDHRNGADDDSAWDLGEDLPGGALRNMADPTTHQQPDTTASALYDADPGYQDAGGVHTNSGIPTKTAYLISQGGSFNGQDIPGIDAGDPSLAKSARLYLQVIETLPSGADFAQLGNTLGQACATLQGAGVLTAANCQAVTQARAATMLSVTPANAAQPDDADLRCPAGTVRRVLLDSEAGTPEQQLARFSTDTTNGLRAFTRTPDWGSNATSGLGSWFVDDQRVAGTSDLSSASAISLPPGQKSYLSFQGWYLLDHDPSGYYDGGTVGIVVDNQTNYPAQHFGSNWVNGPDRLVVSDTGNPIYSDRMFAGDSHGWVGSRLDLSEFAGHQVTPRFRLGTDADPSGYDFSMIGWYLDDIQVYTCDPIPAPVTSLSNTGVAQGSRWSPVLQRIAWRAPTVNSAAVVAYRIWVNNVYVKTVDPDIRSVQLKLDTTRLNTIRVRAAGYGSIQSLPEETKTVPSRLSMTLARTGSTLTFHGALRKNSIAFGNQKLWIQTKSGSLWVTIKSAITTSSGAYTATLKGAVVAPYRVRFAGAPGVTGTLSAWVRK